MLVRRPLRSSRAAAFRSPPGRLRKNKKAASCEDARKAQLFEDSGVAVSSVVGHQMRVGASARTYIQSPCQLARPLKSVQIQAYREKWPISPQMPQSAPCSKCMQCKSKKQAQPFAPIAKDER
jgi:hypothetical protein